MFHVSLNIKTVLHVYMYVRSILDTVDMCVHTCMTYIYKYTDM
jgi:hypothetical protein